MVTVMSKNILLNQKIDAWLFALASILHFLF